MNTKLNIELFKFNHKTDYLPYYKHYEIQYNDNQTVSDILEKIDSIEKLGYEKNCNLRINGLYINSSKSIAEVVEILGRNLKFDPISEYRSKNDLIIINSDYVDKIKLFSSFLNKEEIESYMSLRLYELQYYASNTINYNKDYIGDHALIIAYDIIKNKPHYTDEVLNILADSENGIYQYTSSKNRIFDYDSSFEKKVEYLFDLVLKHSKSALTKSKFFTKEHNNSVSIVKKTKIDKKKAGFIKQQFNNFNIAYYDGLDPSELRNTILDSKAQVIDIQMHNEDLPLLGFEQSKKLLYKMCAAILLQAKDNGADFLVVKEEDLLGIFDKQQKKISQIAGREIDMIVISQNQFIKILEGERDKEILGFNNHEIKVEFLESA